MARCIWSQSSSIAGGLLEMPPPTCGSPHGMWIMRITSVGILSPSAGSGNAECVEVARRSTTGARRPSSYSNPMTTDRHHYKNRCVHTCTHTFNGPGWAATRKVKPIWIFYWSKRQWVAVVSAGPYASLHLAPDRKPCQHPTTQFFTGRMPFLLPNQKRQSTGGNHYKNR